MNHAQMQHFSSGPWALLIAYAVSVIGSLIGLSCMARARAEATFKMHYMGMSAIHFKGEIAYSQPLVATSVVIAVVAATAAFWFTLVVKTNAAGVVAGLIMGVAVTGMHYTGMAAVHVNGDANMSAPQGTTVFDLVFPVFVSSGLVVAVLLWMLFTSANDPFSAEAEKVA